MWGEQYTETQRKRIMDGGKVRDKDRQKEMKRRETGGGNRQRDRVSGWRDGRKERKGGRNSINRTYFHRGTSLCFLFLRCTRLKKETMQYQIESY